MSNLVKTLRRPSQNQTTIIVSHTGKIPASSPFNPSEKKIINKRLKEKLKITSFQDNNRWLVFVDLSKNKGEKKHLHLERARKIGAQICDWANKNLLQTVLVEAFESELAFSFTEGIVLNNYQFLKYFKDKKKRTNSLKTIYVAPKSLPAQKISKLNVINDSVTLTRDWVNEPLSYLTAPKFASELTKEGRKAGIKVQVLEKKQIQSLKMGGVLAVNKGSVDPPTFTIMSWKPKKVINKNPIVLVGKGIVYDTGGLSLKPTPNSMDYMKCDMAGAAMMAGSIIAIAKTKLPIHVIALIPATDNRPGLNAYAPGDVITMHSGHTVEVLNTDAEGRLVMADALSYAKKYDPHLVIDAATLTGAAVGAIGHYGSCIMGTAPSKTINKIVDAGYRVFERCAEMPFWSEYGEEMKSEIADLKNLGGRFAGQITAGKFLENFTDYPWIHIDIAGTSYLHQRDSYRSKYATGYGVRLLLEYMEKLNKSDF